MPATYSTSLRLVKPATGDTGWGTTVNSGLTDLVDFSVAGTSTITMTATDHTLTNNNGATDEARAMFLTLSGTPGGSYNVICPAVSKLYFVTNSTGYAQTVKTASGTGISVPDGQTRALYCNGTNVVNAINSMGSLSLGSALGVASGGTGAGSFTTNYVLLGNGTSAFQTIAPGSSGNILTSNGTTWASSAPPVGGISYTKVTSTTTATDKQGLIADTGGGPFTINLPATPSTGFQVIIADGDNWATNNLTVGRNGSTIEGLAQDLVCDITGASVTLIYDGTTWEVFAQIGGAGGSAATITSTNTFTAAQIFRAASAVRSEAAATQDAVVLAGRAGGTSSYAVTLTPATLSANRTATLPDETFTVGFRNIPAVGTKTGSYSLAVGDVGKYVQVGSGGSITIPNSTFAEGDVVMVYNNTTGNITITCSTTNAYIAGTDTNKASVTLATRGVANIFFYSSTACVITGNVS